ncbi:hypothetical protein M433DRAFT_2998 [Acidomyces richmondensis BFW]|nr:MAG: hypothetical protein FE78DRAFT_29448 [Acidomyces sp. 'richmondensis']KYG47266.1 hypothetical protein M433DRAFT_2998 [Acidomyces richmondensis BFW]
MSGAADSGSTAGKTPSSNTKDASQQLQPQKPAAQLEEDDEFEDFPVEDWAKEEEVGAQANNTHLWEESWDDDDTTDDFSVQLKEELRKMGKS